MKDKILIADDDMAIAELISDALSDEGFDTVVAHSGDEAIDLIEEHDPSLILLDIMMPGMDGLEVCRRVRDNVSCPIVFLTAKNRTVDTLVGLNMGADDYIAKPFVVDELTARVKAHLRREARKSNECEDEGLIFGDLQIFPDRYTVLKNGKPIALSSREFQVLSYLASNADKVLSKEQIFEHVWGTTFGDIGTVAVNIKGLRTKLDPDEMHIKTVWGVGYTFTS